MKKNTIVPITIASSFLYAGAASAGSTHSNETDLIYGNGNVVADQREIYATGSLMQRNKSTDLISDALQCGIDFTKYPKLQHHPVFIQQRHRALSS